MSIRHFLWFISHPLGPFVYSSLPITNNSVTSAVPPISHFLPQGFLAAATWDTHIWHMHRPERKIVHVLWGDPWPIRVRARGLILLQYTSWMDSFEACFTCLLKGSLAGLSCSHPQWWLSSTTYPWIGFSSFLPYLPILFLGIPF